MFTFNQSVFKFFYAADHRTAFLNWVAIFFAQYLPYILVLAFLVLVYYQKGWRNRVYLFCEATLAIILARGIITTVIQYFYNHPRPYVFYSFTPLISESGSSFPSAHAAWFFALGMSIYYFNRKWGVWYFILALLMGIARIYAGVHWPLDIIGGAVIGIASAMFVHWLLRENRKELN